MHRVKSLLPAFLIVGLALAAPALAEPTDVQTLTKNPQDFLGEEVVLEGYCVKGGRSGN